MLLRRRSAADAAGRRQ